MTDQEFITAILEETGCDKTVDTIFYDEENFHWVITWKDTSLIPDIFSSFDRMYDFLKHG
jgi:hypothetical protein